MQDQQLQQFEVQLKRRLGDAAVSQLRAQLGPQLERLAASTRQLGPASQVCAAYRTQLQEDTFDVRARVPQLGAFLTSASSSPANAGVQSAAGLRVPLAGQVEREGSVVLPARLLVDVVRALGGRGSENVTLELRQAEQDVELKALSAQQASRWAVEQTSAQNEPWDVREAALRLGVPTHIIASDPAVYSIFKGPLVDEVRANPHVSVSVVTGAGHSPHRDRPDETMRQLLEALG